MSAASRTFVSRLEKLSAFIHRLHLTWHLM
jgi:hypothetical protein